MRFGWVSIAVLVVCGFGSSLAIAGAQDSAAISAANLYANESHWPNHVKLVAPIIGDAGQVLVPVSRIAVLVRVQEDGRLRVDFGRMGRHTIDAASTDVVARANELLAGGGIKMGPNLTLAIATKLADASKERPVPFDFRAQGDLHSVLCVFADPEDEGFAAMASALAPLHRRDGVTTVLFPRTDQVDALVAKRLRAVEWPVPFAFNVYAEPIARALMPEGAAFPWIQLATQEGRIIAEGPFHPEIVDQLERAIEAQSTPLH